MIISELIGIVKQHDQNKIKADNSNPCNVLSFIGQLISRFFSNQTCLNGCCHILSVQSYMYMRIVVNKKYILIQVICNLYRYKSFTAV